ncbi:MAG TPA: tRNA (N6-threonylcarbamoyladenosine(37)-N6)-methyltransferase TrmO [Sumerlaeia bacterium]|nr:tRNA (N6-threonylcarbamoyladenosine(37)-N6)-methyltransferase TrmO [Sumerlaeia bacterium]
MEQSDSDGRDVISFRPIGRFRTPHTLPERTPIQPCFAAGCVGRVEIFPEYEEGLQDIEGFSHVIVLYHLHRAGPVSLKVRPFLEDRLHGVFATRHTRRPNPLGLSVLRLIKREGRVLVLDGVDVLDGTPVLDVKPFVSRFDVPNEVRNGWIEGVAEQEAWRRGRRETKTGDET